MPMPPFNTAKRRVRRKRLNDVPGTPLPPSTIHVVAVRESPGEPTVATWIFDEDIDDPTSAPIGLVVNGNPGTSWLREDTNALRVEHNSPVSAGMPWSNTAFAGGIEGTDGSTLDAGSGTVVE
jgi:hypothetical protein